MALKYKHRLLVVDDEEYITKALYRIFRKEGYEIHTASSGQEALGVLKEAKKPFSLIISDQRMPGMTGVQFLEKAKKILPDTIRILLTGYSDMDATVDAINKGEIHRYLTKPWKDDDLLIQIKQALEQYELRAENRRLLALTRRQNRELEKERNLLRTVIDNLPDCIYVEDTDSRYAVTNNAHMRFFGATTPEAVIGKTAFELFPKELAEQYYADDQQVIRSGQPMLNREEHSVDKKGNRIWNLTTKVPFRASSGKIVGLVGIARDITGRKKMEEDRARLIKQLQQTNRKLIKSNQELKELTAVLEALNARLKKAIEERKRVESQLVQNAKMASLGELVAGIAHEINNPLGFIHANLGNLKKFSKKIIGLIESYDQVDIPGEAKEEFEKRKKEVNYDYLRSRMPEMIERSAVGADRMKKIIQDLRSFSRLDAAEFAEADINGAIETTLGIMFHEYKNRIGIKKELGNLPAVECYISRLNQVFMNLLINACHAIEDKGEIGIKTGTEDETVKIEISDTGKGIPDDAIDKIFDPFFTTKPVGQGTGLGLSISHGIIEQHKGEISVKSNSGEGTTFTIRIPIHLKKEDLDD